MHDSIRPIRLTVMLGLKTKPSLIPKFLSPPFCCSALVSHNCLERKEKTLGVRSVSQTPMSALDLVGKAIRMKKRVAFCSKACRCILAKSCLLLVTKNDITRWQCMPFRKKFSFSKSSKRRHPGRGHKRQLSRRTVHPVI